MVCICSGGCGGNGFEDIGVCSRNRKSCEICVYVIGISYIDVLVLSKVSVLVVMNVLGRVYCVCRCERNIMH